MNKPVAWINYVEHSDFYDLNISGRGIPLYTHPVKEQKCIVKDCENHKHEGGFVGDLCKPCYQFITTGEGIYSQAYRNSHPAKELTDEEIISTMVQFDVYSNDDQCLIDAGKAILRKAQEK